MMYDWAEMANEVGRKLVEKGQTRILQRIYDGVTSNWILDVADDKGSINHQLIHLIWRKFPRNQHSAEERRPTAVSTQTEEESSNALLRLGVGTSADLTGLSKKNLEKNCYSGSDMGRFFEAENTSSLSDEGSSPDFYSSGLAESEQMSLDYSPENTSFILPSKRRSGKLLIKEKKFHPELTNRFDCFQEISLPETSNVIPESKDQQMTSVPQKTRPPTPPKVKPNSKIPETPKNSFTKSRPLTSEIPTTSTQANVSSKLRQRGIMKWYDPIRMPYGFITMDNKVVFFHIKNVRTGEDHALKPGDEVTFIPDEYDKGVIDVKFLPTLSDFPSTSNFLAYEVESHLGDEPWETVDSDSENEELDDVAQKTRQDMKISYETQLCQLKASIDMSNKPSPENMPFNMPTTSSIGTPDVGGFPPTIRAFDMLSCLDKDGKVSLEKYNRLMDSWGMMRAEAIYPP